GTVTGVGGTFAGIEALTGNANTDAFTFTDAGSITGSLNGAGGTNTLTGDDDGNAFVVTGANTGTLAATVGGTWSNIASLTGGAGDDTFALTGGTLSGSLAGGGGTDTLTADNVANTWNVNAAGGGTVTGITGTFAGIENLTGGTGTDDFSFDNSGSVAGNVDGGGGAGANTLTGDADGNAFGITGANAGTLIGKVGGTWWNIGTLTGGAGADSFIFDNLGTLSGSLNGAAGTDTLDVSALVAPPAVAITAPGSGDGFQGTANPPITGGFDNINAITGGSVTVSIGPGDDTYNYNANTGALAIGASILATASLNSLTINSGAGDDRLTVDASAGDTALQNITNGFTFNGGGQVTSDMLAVIGDANNDTAVYTPDAVTQGNGTISLNAKTITFTGLEPVDITGMATATVQTPGAADVLTLTNGADFTQGGGNAAIRVTGTSGGVGIEAAALWNNTTVVIDTATTDDGADAITIASADNAHGNANLTLSTGAGADTVTFNGAVSVTGTMTITSTDAAVVDDAADAVTDVTAQSLTIAGATVGVGAGGDLDTSVDSLTVTTTGNQNLREANGLTDLNLNAGGGNVTLVLTEGAVTDADGTADITANVATVTLTDTNDGGDNFGAVANPINTTVADLSVDT
ncbi:MAG: hypothetical protein GW892_33810, partial [Armatimonadetes bacterium]|nr:hypothetical protein [Armatimonadota bacterium]